MKAMEDVKVKLNCWEFKKCGRQPGGTHVFDLGVCPVAVEKRRDGTHGGNNAGRVCWAVASTFCEGVVQGTFAKKYESCRACEFYNKVKKEENGSYELSIIILNKLK